MTRSSDMKLGVSGDMQRLSTNREILERDRCDPSIFRALLSLSLITPNPNYSLLGINAW
jgi:hypothetical protein